MTHICRSDAHASGGSLDLKFGHAFTWLPRLAHHNEGCPIGGVGLARLAVVDEGQHGSAQRLGAAKLASRVMPPTAEVMSFTVAAESTDQCDTSRARAPAYTRHVSGSIAFT